MDDLIFLDSKVKMPLMEIPVRTVLVRAGKHQILISPGSQLTEAQYQTIPGVTDIVAPSLLHEAGVTKASAQFPFATLWGSEGVEGKYPDLAWKIIAGGAGWPYREVLEPFALRGMPSVNEIVFYHRPSKSLIVTDLCFNMVGVKGIAARILLRAFGTYNRLGVSRLFVSYIKDRRAFKESVQDILSLEFNRIVVSHGAVVEGDARSKLKACLDERELGN